MLISSVNPNTVGVKKLLKAIIAHENSITFSFKGREIQEVIYKMKPKDKYMLAT